MLGKWAATQLFRLTDPTKGHARKQVPLSNMSSREQFRKKTAPYMPQSESTCYLTEPRDCNQDFKATGHNPSSSRT
eukprot:4195410-Amphidinium_carterae.1